MGKAGKRQEMVEDRSSARVLCEKVYTMYLKKYVWVLWRWWKADCVKKVRMRDLRVWESCLWEGCVWASCVWESVCELRGDGGREIVWGWESCMWKSCVWNCCVACVAKDSCAKTIESGLGNFLSWLQRIVADRLLPGPSWKLTVRRRCLRQAAACHVATGARARWSKWKHTKRKKLSSGAFHWQSRDPRTGDALRQRWWPVESVPQYSELNSIFQKPKKVEFQIWLEEIKKSRFPWNKSTFQTRYQNPIGCKFRYQMLLWVFI